MPVSTRLLSTYRWKTDPVAFSALVAVLVLVLVILLQRDLEYEHDLTKISRP